MTRRNSGSSGNNVDASQSEDSLEALLRSRFISALQRRRIPNDLQQPSAESSSNNNGSRGTIMEWNAWRAIDGESDGLPGVAVDVYGSVRILNLLPPLLLLPWRV